MNQQYTLRKSPHEATEEFSVELDKYLRDRFGYCRRLASARFHTVVVNRSKVQMYLRLLIGEQGPQDFWPSRTLVIASIEFRETRTGHGRSLLKFLVQRAEKFGYDYIGVECTIPWDGIQGFCQHFFNPYDPEESGRLDYNWVAPVTLIAQQLDIDSLAQLKASA